jgi:hypothetical protein
MNRYLYPTYKHPPIVYPFKMGDTVILTKEAIRIRGIDGNESVVGKIIHIRGKHYIVECHVLGEADASRRAWTAEYLERIGNE